MLGHWTVAVVTRDGDTLEADNVLASARWLQLGTWLVQVMPLFFFVGGFSNLRAVEHGRSDGAGHRAYLVRRLGRLMRPTLVFVLVWLVVVTVMGATTLDPDLVDLAGSVAAQPLWFLAVYLMVVGLAPLMVAAHERSRVVPLVVLVAAVVALDVGRLTFHLDGLALGNYVLVFLFAQQLGFSYGDGRLERAPTRTMLGAAAAAVALLAVLTTVGPYPLSMVGVPGEEVSNMSPPTVCILVLAVAQVGVAMSVRPAVNRWLSRPRTWAVTVAVNARIMTLFLWHLSALIAAASLLVLVLGFPTSPAASAGWWLSRPVWFATAGAFLALFLVAFGWAETLSAPRREARGPGWVAVVGLVLVVRGMIGLAYDGFANVVTAPDHAFLGLALSPALDAALLVAGYVLVVGLPTRGASREAAG